MAREFVTNTSDELRWLNIKNPSDGPYSFAGWYYFNTTNEANMVLFAIGNGPNTGHNFLFRKLGGSGSNGILRMLHSFTTGDKSRETVNNSLISDRWYHIVLTDSGGMTGTNIRIFIDGNEASYGSATDGSGTVRVHSGDWMVGKHIGNTTNTLTGRVAHPAAWTRVLTGPEIRRLASGIIPTYITNSLIWAPKLDFSNLIDPYSSRTGTQVGTIVGGDPPQLKSPSIMCAHMMPF